MLTSIRASLVVLLLSGSLCACGSETLGDSSPGADLLCSSVLADRELGVKPALRAADLLDPDDLNRWLRQRAEQGGPSISLADYPSLDSSAPTAVCLFEAAPRPIPREPEAKDTPADGIRVFVQKEGVLVVDAIGPFSDLRASQPGSSDQVE